jgi:hypothetical protein
MPPDHPKIERETAIAQGTVLLRPAELAPRIGLGTGRSGREKVIARAKAGLLPHMRPSPKIFLFCWPDVMRAMGTNHHARKRKT